jgi:ParB family chromosome partitioning protein
VVAGTVPLNVAITIATAGTPEVQQALNDAYEKGDLRGRKLIAVQRMIARRSVKERRFTAVSIPTQAPIDLVKEYETQTRRQRSLLKRAAIVEERLALVTTALKSLLADERLRRLLRTEGVDSMPEQLASRLV